MTIREALENTEKQLLSPYASLSSASRGRARPQNECDIRSAFQRDRDRILHSKSFRRLKDKTQVFLTPQGDHYRTRLTHTLEVSQIARTIARALRLNEDLTEAIALGHDLGHTPFGHAGEEALNGVCPYGFVHSDQSVRVVSVLERGGRGLNLTWETLDGIKNHQSDSMPSTLEGQIVRLADKVAYLHHDMEDAIRAGILKSDVVPDEIGSVLGKSTSERLDTFVHDIIRQSQGKDRVEMSHEVDKACQSFRHWMYVNVYTNRTAKGEDEKAEGVVKHLYEYFRTHLEKLPPEYTKLPEYEKEPEIVVCDYVSSMTDRYAIGLYSELFIPNPWMVK